LVGTPRCGVRSAWSTLALNDLISPFMPLPVRTKLPHDVPLWVDPTKETYFITVCCLPRGLNQLAKSNVAAELFETLSHRNALSVWSVRLALLMPDHIHLIVSFPENGRKIRTIISKWKELDGQSPRDSMAARFL